MRPSLRQCLVSTLLGLLLFMEAATADDLPDAARACRECHSVKGLVEHPGAPIIDGQDRRYLEHQLTAFQRDFTASYGSFARLDRKHPVMSKQGQGLDKKDIHPVAAYFSRLACRSARTIDAQPEAPRPPDALVSRCLFCHGQGGRDQHSFIPNLAGQRKTYLVNQLKSFRDTTWRDAVSPGASRHHNMMSRQGSYLTDADMEVLAAYFAGLPCR